MARMAFSISRRLGGTIGPLGAGAGPEWPGIGLERVLVDAVIVLCTLVECCGSGGDDCVLVGNDDVAVAVAVAVGVTTTAVVALVGVNDEESSVPSTPIPTTPPRTAVGRPVRLTPVPASLSVSLSLLFANATSAVLTAIITSELPTSPLLLLSVHGDIEDVPQAIVAIPPTPETTATDPTGVRGREGCDDITVTAWATVASVSARTAPDRSTSYSRCGWLDDDSEWSIA